jgi:hypothetical protein
MFSLYFYVKLCCLTKRLTNEKGHPETTGWPTIGAMVPLADSYDLPAALGCDLNLLLNTHTGVHLGTMVAEATQAVCVRLENISENMERVDDRLSELNFNNQ